MLTLSNIITFIRAPLALLFLQSNIHLRALAIILAMITDAVDGYLARRNKSISKFGTILDPLMDKLFVYFVLAIFWIEKDVKLWELLAMLSRDISLLIFAIFITFKKEWKKIKWQAVFWGKVSTVAQFIVLFLLSLHLFVPSFVYLLFFFFGIMVLFDLFNLRRGN